MSSKFRKNPWIFVNKYVKFRKIHGWGTILQVLKVPPENGPMTRKWAQAHPGWGTILHVLKVPPKNWPYASIMYIYVFLLIFDIPNWEEHPNWEDHRSSQKPPCTSLQSPIMDSQVSMQSSIMEAWVSMQSSIMEAWVSMQSSIMEAWVSIGICLLFKKE